MSVLLAEGTCFVCVLTCVCVVGQLSSSQTCIVCDRWRDKYLTLFASVEPFAAQLDAYAAEKHCLLGRSAGLPISYDAASPGVHAGGR